MQSTSDKASHLTLATRVARTLGAAGEGAELCSLQRLTEGDGELCTGSHQAPIRAAVSIRASDPLLVCLTLASSASLGLFLLKTSGSGIRSKS